MVTLRRVCVLLAALFTLTGISISSATPSRAADTDRFITAVAPAAQRAHQQYRVPASVSIAQSILESGWGSSVLAVYGHAYFGIKCKTDYTSPYQLGCMDKSSLEYFDQNNPVAVVSAFRTYRSADDSFADHGYFLKNSSRYAAAFSTNNPDDFIREVGKAGYATDANYAQTIIDLMNRYSLYRFDVDAASTRPVAVDGAIGAKYAQIGGAASALSYPIGGEQAGPVSGSRMVTFNKGILPWTYAHGAHPIVGAMWNAYRTSQGVREHLGFVASDQYSGSGAVMQQFSGGRMYLINGRNYNVWGEIWRKYAALGAERGALGLPTGPEVCGLHDGGCYQNFTGGHLAWTPAYGAHPVWGLIREKYGQTGWDGGPLGWPTTDEVCANGGCFQNYQRGHIAWTPATGAYPVWGAIRAKYGQTGFDRGPLRWPTSDGICGIKDNGCFQDYQGGHIAWSPATGAHPVWGAIRAQYGALGWDRGRLGLPVSDEQCGLANGGCTQRFQGGSINWAPATGAYPVW